MPTPADSPLRKVTLNLYEDDCQVFEQHYGHGWSSYIRDLVHNHADSIRQIPKRRTLGGLIKEDAELIRRKDERDR